MVLGEASGLHGRASLQQGERTGAKVWIRGVHNLSVGQPVQQEQIGSGQTDTHFPITERCHFGDILESPGFGDLQGAIV